MKGLSLCPLTADCHLFLILYKYTSDLAGFIIKTKIFLSYYSYDEVNIIEDNDGFLPETTRKKEW